MSDSSYSIERLLCPEQQGVLSLTGGGGKTSLLFHLANILARSGKRVLTTTTTKIMLPSPEQSRTVIINADPEIILQQASSLLHQTGHITAAADEYKSGKLQGFAPEAIQIFRKPGLFDWILVEADGASRRPLKAPAGHEPVIPCDTSVLVAVTGLDVLGQPLTEDLVFRSALAGPLMDLAKGEIISEAALARLLAHPLGAFKAAPQQARRIIFLNKADTPDRCEQGDRVASQLQQMEHPAAEIVIIGRLLNGAAVHSVHPLTAQT